MKTTLKTVALATAPLAAALLLTPGLALAQSGAAAGAVPNSFDAPAQTHGQTQGQAHGQTQTVRPGSAAPDAQAPDVARSQEALRGVIAAAQGAGFDYSVFTPDLASKIRQQAAQVTPLIKSFGALKSVDYQRQEGEAQLFKVTFDNQVTEWMIGFDADDKIAALLFRPARD
ncbi:hypothetical protein [Brevundimonas sp.]|uniref:hypothetical protein n=1 Tax=Brevundimonas sp. TaxID=1871086 RepID=UPI0028A23592|nr:hypothetical protein [Brevundimonas sp.]